MGLMIDLRVAPASGKLKAIIDKAGMLKIYLKNQAEDGKANKELVTFLAKSLGIPQNTIIIMSGLTARKKRIFIDAQITLQQLLGALNIDQQLPLKM
jgi:uncharacterized protein